PCPAGRQEQRLPRSSLPKSLHRPVTHQAVETNHRAALRGSFLMGVSIADVQKRPVLSIPESHPYPSAPGSFRKRFQIRRILPVQPEDRPPNPPPPLLVD